MMKILHVTDQLSKKNYSISSLISYISSKISNKYRSISIASTFIEKQTFEFKKNISVAKIGNWPYFFLYKVKEFNFVHVHGIWSLFQTLSIISCNIFRVEAFIHPHGMLLEDALKSGGKIKYILKLIVLNLLSLVLKKNINFIAITNQELNAIKNFFPKSKIFKIENPIPFKQIQPDKILNKKKKIVYFGRIHPHKNLELLIDSFINSNLQSNWELDIYGIPDDDNYFKKISSKIADLKNISIKKPIFGNEKIQVMKSAWLNVLLSKSEVLSLSILEASQYGLPTLICSDFDTDKNRMLILKSQNNIYDISKKITKISRWSKKKRNSISEFFIKNNKFNLTLLDNKYNNIYERIDYKKEKKVIFGELTNYFFRTLVNLRKLRFYIYSISYLINFVLPSLFLILSVVVEKNNLAAEIGIVSGFWITLTQILSSNIRALSVYSSDLKTVKLSLIYRFFVSLISILLFILFSKFIYFFEFANVLIPICILILLKWTNEMLLAQTEIQKKIKPFISYLSINSIFIILVFIYFANDKINLLIISIYFLITIIGFNLLKNIYSNLSLYNYKNIIKNILFNISSSAFASSFALVSSSFLWRLFIYNYLSKDISGVIFAAFSIGSFPGTLFNSIIGPIVVKEGFYATSAFKKVVTSLFFVLLILAIYQSSSMFMQADIMYDLEKLFYFTINISLIGSFFMCMAMYYRHLNIFKGNIYKDFILRIDLVYGFALIFIVPILYFIFGLLGITFSFFLGSILAFLIYYNYYHNAKLL